MTELSVDYIRAQLLNDIFKQIPVEDSKTKLLCLIFKAVRRVYKMRQIEFSIELGCTQGSVSKFEAGSFAPDVFLVFKLSKRFGIPMEDIRAFVEMETNVIPVPGYIELLLEEELAKQKKNKDSIVKKHLNKAYKNKLRAA